VTSLEIFGLVVGVFLIADGALNWGLVATIRPASRAEIRGSEIVIGAIFVLVAILLLAGVFHTGR
jgi:hypothetical protein